MPRAEMNRLAPEKQSLLLRCLTRGSGVRDCASIVECDPGTVVTYLRRFGTALRHVHESRVVRLRSTRIEVDEIWSYVYGKDRNRHRFDPKAPSWAGDYFTWTALDPDSKLLIALHVSKRTRQDCLTFLSDVRNRVSGAPLITTDSYPAYKRAVAEVFGSDVKHVRLKKEFKSVWDRETGDRQVRVTLMEKVPQRSNISERDIALASTSHNERHNASIRNYVSRFQRQTYGFSKTVENHRHSQDIYAAYYNFVKEHRSLGSETPAMRAGVADRLWSFNDLIAEVSTYWAKQVEPLPDQGHCAANELQALPPREAAEHLSYFVCYDTLGQTAKVHAGSCCNCRHGLGRGGSGATNRWYGFDDVDGARRAAAALAPGDDTDCAICIRKSYRTRFQPA